MTDCVQNAWQNAGRARIFRGSPAWYVDAMSRSNVCFLRAPAPGAQAVLRYYCKSACIVFVLPLLRVVLLSLSSLLLLLSSLLLLLLLVLLLLSLFVLLLLLVVVVVVVVVVVLVLLLLLVVVVVVVV